MKNADLCGIRWRQLVYGERPNASSDPLDDPVLRSYSKCLAVDILCVWRRVAAPKPKPKLDPDPSSMFDMSIPGTGNSGSVLHPPLSLTAAKELWIFWYGEEPDLTELVAPELLNSSEVGDGGRRHPRSLGQKSSKVHVGIKFSPRMEGPRAH
uniref:Mediator of RNA polymerase II transcription subunit 13 n=1 Tax=Anopheles albimanus TaxID=7167 RepID=A0A182FFB4_ANOAL